MKVEAGRVANCKLVDDLRNSKELLLKDKQKSNEIEEKLMKLQTHVINLVSEDKDELSLSVSSHNFEDTANNALLILKDRLFKRKYDLNDANNR